MPATIAAARAGVTTGEWAQALRDVYGDYRAPTGVGEASSPASGETSSSCATRSRACSEALGRRIKILVGKPGLDGHSNGAEQIAVRARDVGTGRRLRGHPADAVADRHERAAGGRPRDRAVDPVGLAPRADPDDHAGAGGGRRRRARRCRRDHPGGRRRRRCRRRVSRRSTRPKDFDLNADHAGHRRARGRAPRRRRAGVVSRAPPRPAGPRATVQRDAPPLGEARLRVRRDRITRAARDRPGPRR